MYDYSEKSVCVGNLTRAQADAFEKMPEQLKNSLNGNASKLAKMIGTHHSVLSLWIKTKETYKYRTSGMYVDFPVVKNNSKNETEPPMQCEEDFDESNVYNKSRSLVNSRSLVSGPTGPTGKQGFRGIQGAYWSWWSWSHRSYRAFRYIQ